MDIKKKTICTTIIILLLLMTLHSMSLDHHDVSIKVRTLRKKQSVNPYINTIRLTGCINTDLLINESTAVVTMLQQQNQGSVRSLIAMSEKCKTTMILFEIFENPITPNYRRLLQHSGWKICTVRRLGPSRDSYTLIRMWELNLKRIYYISPQSLVMTNISSISNSLPIDIKTIGAVMSYNIKSRSWNKNEFSTQSLVVSPNRRDAQLLRRELSLFGKSGSHSFHTVVNKVFKNKWINVGFGMCADSSLSKLNRPYWQAFQSNIFIICFTNPPWLPQTELHELWSSNSSKLNKISRFPHLWQRTPQDLIHTTSPLTQYTTDIMENANLYIDPLQYKKNNAMAIQNPISMKIVTADRRIERIKRKIEDIQHDWCSDDVPTDHEWVITIGIPTTDTENSLQRRLLQRDTCFSSPVVWSSTKKFSPLVSVLVKYIISTSEIDNSNPSASMLTEAALTRDFILFNIESDTNLPNRQLSQNILSCRKLLAWFNYVADTYKTDYVAKASEDSFINIPRLLWELYSLQVPRIHFGRRDDSGIKEEIYSTTSSLVIFSFDVVDWFRDSSIVETLTDFFNESVLPSLWLHIGSVPVNKVSHCGISKYSPGSVPSDFIESVQVANIPHDVPQFYYNLVSLYASTPITPPTEVWSSLPLRFGENFFAINRKLCKELSIKLFEKIPFITQRGSRGGFGLRKTTASRLSRISTNGTLQTADVINISNNSNQLTVLKLNSSDSHPTNELKEDVNQNKTSVVESEASTDGSNRSSLFVENNELFQNNTPDSHIAEDIQQNDTNISLSDHLTSNEVSLAEDESFVETEKFIQIDDVLPPTNSTLVGPHNESNSEIPTSDVLQSESNKGSQGPSQTVHVSHTSENSTTVRTKLASNKSIAEADGESHVEREVTPTNSTLVRPHNESNSEIPTSDVLQSKESLLSDKSIQIVNVTHTSVNYTSIRQSDIEPASDVSMAEVNDSQKSMIEEGSELIQNNNSDSLVANLQSQLLDGTPTGDMQKNETKTNSDHRTASDMLIPEADGESYVEREVTPTNSTLVGPRNEINLKIPTSDVLQSESNNGSQGPSQTVHVSYTSENSTTVHQRDTKPVSDMLRAEADGESHVEREVTPTNSTLVRPHNESNSEIPTSDVLQSKESLLSDKSIQIVNVTHTSVNYTAVLPK